jgi:hypothetical protein
MRKLVQKGIMTSMINRFRVRGWLRAMCHAAGKPASRHIAVVRAA